MKNIIITLIAIVLLTPHVNGQEKDETRMNRDIEITEDIINSLVKNESKDGHFYSAQASAKYVDGFGVMINLRQKGNFFSASFDDNQNIFVLDDESFSFNLAGLAGLADLGEEIEAEALERQSESLEREAEALERQAEALEREAEALEREVEAQERETEALMREAEKMAREKEKSKSKNKNKSHSKSHTSSYSYAYTPDPDNESSTVSWGVVRHSNSSAKSIEEIQTMYKRVMTIFFTDYADLIGQLRDNEKILISTKINQGGSSSRGYQKLSGSITRKDLSQYKSGKISQEKFESLINFDISQSTEKTPDLELLSSIFQRLYKSDLATTYYVSGGIKYERVKGLGAIYDMKVYSSISDGSNTHRIVTTGESKLSSAERNKVVDGMYSKFVNELKSNLLDYGKTVKSLQADESLIINVRLTECKKCAMPKTVSVSVKSKTLSDLNSGKQSKEKALNSITIKEGR